MTALKPLTYFRPQGIRIWVEQDNFHFEHFRESLQKLFFLCADKIVITCLPSHYLFPRLLFKINISGAPSSKD